MTYPERPLKTKLAEHNEEALVFEPPYYDEACIGWAHRYPGIVVAVYDYEKLISSLMKAEEWTQDDAIEWISFNMEGAWVGNNTPIILNKW